nr:tyrosine-type recombinase/integrase [Rossellomorea marisflavi]
MFSDFLLQVENFMVYCDSKALARKTKASYEQTLNLFARYMDEQHNVTEVSEVKTAHIRSYIKYLRERGKYTVVARDSSKMKNFPDNRPDLNKPISDSTIANYVRNIKVFFNFLHSEHEIKENPAEKVKNIKPMRKQKALMTREEIKRILDACETSTFHGFRSWIMIRLMLDTGMRSGECVSLRPENVDFKARAILIENPKNNRQRYVFFSYKLTHDLKRWFSYRDRFSDSPYLFPTIRGTMLDISNFERMLKKIGKQVGVDIHAHQLRNNFAKYYLLNGGDFVTLSRILGHSSVEVTQQAYLDFTDGEVAKKYQQHSPLNNLGL